MGEEAKKKRAARWRLFLTFATFIALIIFVIAARHQIVDTFNNLGKVNTWALLLIIPFQFLNYHCYARLYQGLFKILNEDVGYGEMFKASLEVNFVNNVFPSGGLSTFSYFSARMREFKIPGTKSTLIQLMRFVLIFISFQLLLFSGLFLLALSGHANRVMILITGSLSTMLFVLSLLATYIIGSERRISTFFVPVIKGLNSLINFFRRGKPDLVSVSRAQTAFSNLHQNYLELRSRYKQLKVPLIYGLFANVTEILTLYSVYVAFDKWVNPGAVIIAYAIANFAGIIAVHLPAGVGVYEGLMTGVMVAAGVSPGVSLPATIMYRILGALVQLPPGYYYYYKNINRRKDRAPA